MLKKAGMRWEWQPHLATLSCSRHSLSLFKLLGAHTEIGPSPGPWKPASGLLPSPLDNLMELYFSPLSFTFSQENTVHNMAAVSEVFTPNLTTSIHAQMLHSDFARPTR